MQINDSVRVKISDKNNPQEHEVIKFKLGSEALCIGGRNKGRIGVVTHHTKIQASQDIVSLEGSDKKTFSTQLRNLFVLGESKGSKNLEKAPGNGVRKTITEG